MASMAQVSDAVLCGLQSVKSSASEHSAHTLLPPLPAVKKSRHAEQQQHHT